MTTVTARSFREASAEDWETLVAAGQRAYVEDAGEAFLQMLEAQRDNASHGWMVNNYQHSLQCATRALRAGEDDEFVITALFHDIAQDFYPYAHDRMSAALLAPYLGEENLWVVENHQVFQLAFRTHSRFDIHACEKHSGHPYYERARYFCEHYDQNCFDPDYPHEPLETFAPIVKAHFAAVMRSQIRPY
jgi:predicted HD phosphohydrolase